MSAKPFINFIKDIKNFLFTKVIERKIFIKVVRKINSYIMKYLSIFNWYIRFRSHLLTGPEVRSIDIGLGRSTIAE